MGYEGPDRRQRSEFESEVLRFMSRIDEHLIGQKARCDSHAKDITLLDNRVMDIELEREQIRGAGKLALWISSVPAVGTAAWFFVTWLKGVQGGK